MKPNYARLEARFKRTYKPVSLAGCWTKVKVGERAAKPRREWGKWKGRVFSNDNARKLVPVLLMP